MGRGSNNNRDSKSQRAEFFHSRKNESHSYSKHSEPCGMLWKEKGVSLLFLWFTVFYHVHLLVEDGGESREGPLAL